MLLYLWTTKYVTLSFSGYLYSVHIGQIVTFLDYSPNLTPFLSAVSEAPIFPNEILIGILQAFDSFHVESLQNSGVICFVRWQENFIFKIWNYKFVKSFGEELIP